MQTVELQQKEQPPQQRDDEKTDRDQLTDDYLSLYSIHNNDAP